MFKKIRITITSIIFVLLLFISVNVKAATFTDNQIIDANKIWTIHFNQEVVLDNLTKQGITATDGKGNIANIIISLGKDDKTIIVNAPTGGYTAGEKYMLIIGHKLHSKNNKNLKKSIVLNFSIKSNSNDIVTFKDAYLEEAVRFAIQKLKGVLYKSDVEKITHLRTPNIWTSDLSGIENLTNLQSLNLSWSHVSDLSPLKGLTNLQELDLSWCNQLDNISPLKGLTNLQELNLSSSKVLDISPLKGLTNLQELYLSATNPRDLSPLEGLTNLTYLDLSSNENIMDISSLEGLTNLRYLSLRCDINISKDDKQSLKSLLPKCKIR